ncbi:MAG: type I methionyl aminopeptidase [Actinomycetota bacterium]
MARTMRIRSNDGCWCGSGRKYKRCHGDRKFLVRPTVELGIVSPPRPVPPAIPRPDYVATGVVGTSRRTRLHDDDTLRRHRRAGEVAAEVLLRAGAAVDVGVTTDELDAVAHAAYVDLGAYPSTLGYPDHNKTPYTKSICTSVNGVICHGIPDSRPLADGDIVNIDVTAYVDGMHGDNSAMFVAGTTDPAVDGLIETTREATLRGIAAIEPYAPLRRIGEVIEPFVAARGYSVVREYGGHGIGETFHTALHIHHTIERHVDEIALPGMAFTVEPMVTSGRPTFRTAADGWTEHALDNCVAAQFEHTVHVTEHGVELLTVTADGRTAVGAPADLAAPAPH